MNTEVTTHRRIDGDVTAVASSRRSSRLRSALITPRLMNAQETARYLGHQSRAILKEIPVQPIRVSSSGVGRGALWDRHAIDEWLDQLSGIRHPTAESGPATDDPQTNFDEWRRARDARRN